MKKIRYLPFGYTIRNGQTVIDQQEAETVRGIFTAYIHVASLKEIAEDLTAKNIPYTERSCVWDKARISRILENAKYTGDAEFDAIIDENIKAVDGSRVRLRLLDDIEINESVVRRGTYLYATVSGFSSGRVKGSINSILVEDELVKVSLSIYDTDGLEGLYVPISQFRETSKDVASSAMSGSMNMNTSGYGNSLAQWGMQAVNNAYQKTSNAISKAIKKNKVKLKYGTFVYLVNGRENRN